MIESPDNANNEPDASSPKNSNITLAVCLNPGFVYTMRARYEGVEGDYFRVISNNASLLRRGYGTPNVRCEVVEKDSTDKWRRREGTSEFSVSDIELVRLVDMGE